MDYFAALPPEELAQELQSRIDAYYQWILGTGTLGRWRIAYNTYYGERGAHSSSHVSSQGKQGELSFLMSNEYRSLCQHLLTLAFQSRVALETVSVNQDSKSKKQTYIAKGLLEYYRRDGLIDANSREATEIALIMDVGYVFNEWSDLLGDSVVSDPDSGITKREGDISSRARTPLDVVTDFTKPQAINNDWQMVRDPINKFDLAAQNPEKYDEITNLNRDYTKDTLYRFGDTYLYDSNFASSDIDVWTFYHRRTPSLPEGRIFQFINNELWFVDTPMKYKKLPGRRICPTEKIMQSMGYSNANSLLGLQDAMDGMVSAAVTNMTSCGVNNIWAKPSANLDFEQLGSGMNFIESEEKPEVLILNRLSPEWMGVANFLIQRMEALSGMNAAARGNLEGKDLSGAALALLQSMAIQYNNGLVRAVNQLVEDCGNDLISMLKDFGNKPKLAMIIGKNNEYMMQEFQPGDLDNIERVYARQSGPLQQTSAGKLQMLEAYKSVPGVITQGSQITEIIETGQLDSSTQGGRNLALAIDEENEMLLRGEIPIVVFTDNHPEHMMKHREVFSSPESRKDPTLMQRVKQHYDTHDAVWAGTKPASLMALNIPPYPFPPMPMPGEASPGVMPSPANSGTAEKAPGPQNSNPSGSVNPHPNEVAGIAQEPNQPNLPTNPLSGKTYNSTDGGLG